MKVIVGLASFGLLMVATAASAQVYVNGYYRADGTYVAPHMQSAPNGTTSDNYSTRGNVNPYTGQAGTKPDTRPSDGYSYTPYVPPSTSSYGQPQRMPQQQAPQSSYGQSDGFYHPPGPLDPGF